MRLVTVVGVAAVAVGFAVAFDAGLAASLSLSEIAVTLVGALGVVQGVRYASARRRRDRTALDVGEPERRTPSPVPGEGVDDRLARAAGTSRRRYRIRREIRSQLRDVAVAEVARAHNCDATRAGEILDAGEWTDDPVAAAFLAEDLSYPYRSRVRVRLRRESMFEAGFAAAVDGLDALGDRASGRAAGTSDAETNDAEMSDTTTDDTETSDAETGDAATNDAETGDAGVGSR